MAKYIALIIDNLNHDMSISTILDSSQKINDKIAAYRTHREEMTQQMELPL